MNKLEAKVTQRVLDNLICIQLFNMTYIEFVATAKERAGEKWNTYSWIDDMEAARDELSIVSLQMLSKAESELAAALTSGANMTGRLTPYNALILASGVIKDMAVPKDKIWYEDSQADE